MSCRGRILLGINRIYTVMREDGELFECRIKGKVLTLDEKSYNPLTSGDWVSFEIDENHIGKGMILEKEDRDNSFVRYNKKRNCPQIIAANFDQVICVCSPVSPPFRPRFIDRVAISVPPGTPIIILLNKMDQGIYKEDEARFAHYKKLGYKVHTCSAKTGKGIKELVRFLVGKSSVFVGQSGVGKSSILNVIRPDIEQKIGEISEKYNRGKHTTCFASLFPSPNPKLPEVIDTPGVRELDVYGIEPEDLYHYFPELNSYQGECRFTKCLHQNEPGCAVLKGVEEGKIFTDRYVSYLNILQDLITRRKLNGYR